MRTIGAILFVVASVAACGSDTELFEKKGTFAPPEFASAAEVAAIQSATGDLCTAGQTAMDFDADDVEFGFAFPLEKSATVLVQTSGSEDLDTTLALYGPADGAGYYGRLAVASDDDGGAGLLSRLTYTAPASGNYLALVGTFDGRGRGEASIGVTVDGSAGCPPLKVKPKLDVLWVIDDSSSMARQVQALGTGIPSWLDALAKVEGLDLRVAMTTTNVCDASDSDAVRGRFIYQPAALFESSATGSESRIVPCLTDAQCAGSPDLPDASRWVCMAGSSSAKGLYSCDRPDSTDDYPGDLLFSVTSQCRYSCDPDGDGSDCAAAFGSHEYACLKPGGDASLAGCFWKPAASVCPDIGPTVLDDATLTSFVDAWKSGLWTGDPSWATLDDATARQRIQEQLLWCMLVIRTNQSLCATQEQGLLAAWLALDPSGENAVQAKAFVREDASLLIVFVGDEDDCSTVSSISTGTACSCVADTLGCLADGTCDPAAPGPLYPVSDLADRFRTLKGDLKRVRVAALSGDVVSGSATSPDGTADDVRARYQACKCGDSSNLGQTYICASDRGKSDLGRRYFALARALDSGSFVSNLCEGFDLEGLGTKVATWLMTVE